MVLDTDQRLNSSLFLHMLQTVSAGVKKLGRQLTNENHLQATPLLRVASSGACTLWDSFSTQARPLPYAIITKGQIDAIIPSPCPTWGFSLQTVSQRSCSIIWLPQVFHFHNENWLIHHSIHT